MSTQEIVALVAATLAWVGIIVNLVVLPFFNAREKWHKDYVDSGSLTQSEPFADSSLRSTRGRLSAGCLRGDSNDKTIEYRSCPDAG